MRTRQQARNRSLSVPQPLVSTDVPTNKLTATARTVSQNSQNGTVRAQYPFKAAPPLGGEGRSGTDPTTALANGGMFQRDSSEPEARAAGKLNEPLPSNDGSNDREVTVAGQYTAQTGLEAHDLEEIDLVAHDGFIKPTKVAARNSGITRNVFTTTSSNIGNKKYFPDSFASDGESDPNDKVVKEDSSLRLWSEADEFDDDIGPVPFVVKIEPAMSPDLWSPRVLESDTINRILLQSNENKMLNERMHRINVDSMLSSDEEQSDDLQIHPGLSAYSDQRDVESDTSNNTRKSTSGKYKRPPRPSRLAGIRLEQPDHTASGKRSPAESATPIPFHDKGKWRAETSGSTIREQLLQMEFDRDLAEKLQREERMQFEAERDALKSKINKLNRRATAAVPEEVREAETAARQPSREHRSSDSRSLARSSVPHLGVNLGYERSSSKLPKKSGLRRAMRGDPGDSDSSDSSSDEPRKPSRKRSRPSDSSDSSGSGNESSDYKGRKIFRNGPTSDHKSDSSSTKVRKSEKRRRHRAKMMELKYQQSFLKQDPPFKYAGELQASTFKRWTREIRDWKKRGRLNTKDIIYVSGKYCTGKAYKFFERDILIGRKRYSLTEYFESMFDYLFPATFRMDQRDKFDACYQSEMSALDYLRKLQDIADTVGDLNENDIVLAFWRRCRSYLKSELAKAGLEPDRINLIQLENAVVRLETAHNISETAKKSNERAPGRPHNPSKKFERKEHPKPEASHGESNSRPDFKKKDSKPGRRPAPAYAKKDTRDPARTKRLRDEGRCFLCESKDHLANNCPDRLSKKPPVQLNSIGSMSRNETRLAALDEGLMAGLYSVYPLDDSKNKFVSSSQSSERTEFHKRHLESNALELLYKSVPLSLDFVRRPKFDPFSSDRFYFTDGGQGDCVYLSDNHHIGCYELKYTQLANETFDLMHWLHMRKTEEFEDFCQHKGVPEPGDIVDPFPEMETDEYYTDSAYEDRSDVCYMRPEIDSDPDIDRLNENHSESSPINTYVESNGYLSDKLTAINEWHRDVRESLHLGAVSSSKKKRHEPEGLALERNAARVKDSERRAPKAIIVVVYLDGKPCRALLDSGSLADFVSTNIVVQLKLKYETLANPFPLQLAVSGSRSKVNARVKTEFKYQRIKEARTFDIINLDSYDMILGTPFLFQHKVQIGLNPFLVMIGSDSSVPIEGPQTALLESRVSRISDNALENARDDLRTYALDICKDASETPLPPLRAINHVIPLNDEHKVYSWRPSKCPEALKPLWRAKRDDYLASGRWEYRSGRNAVPMMMLYKPSKDGEVRLRTVCDTRERNKNSRRLSSPLPDIEAILRNITSHKFRSLLDGKDAYEQIRIEPSDVEKSLFATPDGTMVSLVMQIGDCNASATYQSIMCHIFSEYLGIFMDVYLDDICIYSDTLEDHIRHVKLVVDRLRVNKFYLSSHKLQFLLDELKVLGHVIDAEGIRMDPAKVTQVTNWKVPTNKGLVSSFTGSVGYLAPGCKGIRIPMQILSKVAAPSTVWRWTELEQRAFDEVKSIVNEWRDTRRKSVDYSPSAAPLNLVCDGCLTGGSGVFSQGENYLTSDVIAFWSGKFNSAQQNYPVHELELLAIVESLKRFRHLLLGVHFRIYTDHKSLEWITTQKKLSPRQARWLEVLSDFDFEIIHISGVDNVLADALSRIYSDEPSGTVRAESEYVGAEEENAPSSILLGLVSSPVYTGNHLYVAAAKRGPGRPRKVAPPTTSSAREAFPNAKRIVLKFPSSEQQLEGVSDTNNSVIGNTYNHTHPEDSLEDEGAPEAEANETDTITAPQSHLRQQTTTAELENSISGNLAPSDEHLVASEILSEDPITLPQIINSGDPSVDIFNRLVGRYSEDPFFKIIIEKPSEYKNFELSNGLVYLREKDKRLLCIPDIMVGERRIREMLISHAHSILAHLGPRKTIIYLRDNVWWKRLNLDVHSYCDTCVTCKTSKPSNQQPYGLLNTLEVPTRPWETIGIDFVGPLPESSNINGEFDMIMVIICHLTSMVHIVPTRQNYRARDIAEVIFDRVYKLHGMPKNIVSDRDKLFTSTFWNRLNELTGTELRMSSSFHPESDGSTERANRTMAQMLRQCVSPDQKDWVSKIPAIEFAMNSASSATTGFPPFVLNHGMMPRSMVWKGNSDYPGVRIFAQRMKDAILTAHDAILEARVKQTRLANRHRKESPFVKGDLVYLSTKNISLPKGRARKLSPKYIGPFKILDDYKNDTYLLDLPSELKQRGLHPSFHAHLLRIHVPNDDRRFPGRELRQISSVGNLEEWAVSGIESHHGKGKNSMFKLTWKTGDSVWLQYHEVKDLEAFDQYLEALGVTSISSLPKLVSDESGLPLFCVPFSSKLAGVNCVTKRTKMYRAAEPSTPIKHECENQLKTGARLRFDSPKFPSHIPPSSLNTASMPEFQEFATFLHQDKYNPDLDYVPQGYLEWAVGKQFADRPPPFPALSPVTTFVVDGTPTKCLYAVAPRLLMSEDTRFRKGGPGASVNRGIDRASIDRSRKGKFDPKRKSSAGGSFNDAQRNVQTASNKNGTHRVRGFKKSDPHRRTEIHQSFKKRQERKSELELLQAKYQALVAERHNADLTIPGQEAVFGHKVLDNRSNAKAPVASTSTAAEPDISSQSSIGFASDIADEINTLNDLINESSGVDFDMSQYVDDLIIHLRNLTTNDRSRI